MSPQLIGLLLGGLLSGVLYGFNGFFAKLSLKEGVGVGLFLTIAGVIITLVGLAVFAVDRDRTMSVSAGYSAALSGLAWGLASAFFALGIAKYGVPLSKLVLLHSAAPVVIIILSFWIFAEWSQIKLLPFFGGAALLVLGAYFVGKS